MLTPAILACSLGPVPFTRKAMPSVVLVHAIDCSLSALLDSRIKVWGILPLRFWLLPMLKCNAKPTGYMICTGGQSESAVAAFVRVVKMEKGEETDSRYSRCRLEIALEAPHPVRPSINRASMIHKRTRLGDDVRSCRAPVCDELWNELRRPDSCDQY